MKIFDKIHFLNRKGITIVWLALFLLPLLLMFAGLAIDISYMYMAKNELQVAADAACLAGAPKLDGTNSLVQTAARQEAWKLSCRNEAVGANVFLVAGGADCNTPPANLNNGNNANGDIVVGNWNINLSPSFDPSRTPVNAIKVVANRTGAPAVSDVSIGNNPVGVFFGRIFRLIGTDWSLMSVRAEATCQKLGLPIAPFPICFPNCGTSTPLTTVPPNITPGTRFFLKEHDGPPHIGWTTFLDNSTSQPDISAYVLGLKSPPPICNECIYTTQGLVNPSVCDVRKQILALGADYDVNGTTIHGWKVLIPILPPTPCPSAKGRGCFDDPGYQPGDPFQVTFYAEAIVTHAIPQGNCPGDSDPVASGKPGIVFVGTGPGAPGFSTIQCIDCNDPIFQTLAEKAKLVK